MLTLPIKRKWFDMICKCQKREEYRETTEYWEKRLRGASRNYHGCHGQVYQIFPIKIRAGYRAGQPDRTAVGSLPLRKGRCERVGCRPRKELLGLADIECRKD